MSAKPKRNQRWYESEPVLKQSIELLQTFPDEILTIIAEGVNEIAESEFRAEELIRTYRSLGEGKILALYKSKRKLRAYDKNPVMHKAVNYIFLISDESRLILARQIIEMVSLVRDYFQECRDASEPPTMANVKSLRDVYVQHGVKAAREKLQQIRQAFMSNLKNAPQEGERQTNLDDSDSGMRLNFARLGKKR